MTHKRFTHFMIKREISVADDVVQEMLEAVLFFGYDCNELDMKFLQMHEIAIRWFRESI